MFCARHVLSDTFSLNVGALVIGIINQFVLQLF
jgi:hypothetical protein